MQDDTSDHYVRDIPAAPGCFGYPPWDTNDTSLMLYEAYVKGRAAWAALPLSYEQFHSHATRVDLGVTRIPTRPADAYLCAACANGHHAAYTALEARHFPALRVVITQIVGEKSSVEEILQEVRTRLFVGTSPKISTYRCSGPLGAWLRTIAVHASWDLVRERRARRILLQKLAIASPGRAGAFELDDPMLRNEPTYVCEDALRSAIRSLTSTERQLLHHYFVHGLSIDTLDTMYSVHRATIARRIRRAIDQVRARVLRTLTTHFPDLDTRALHWLAFETCRHLDFRDELVRVA